MIKRLLPAFLALPLALAAQPKLELQPFASGFERPVDIAHAGDNRLFIVEQDGFIWILDSLGNRSPKPFLDIDARVRSTGNEQGLLGLAFHPDYAQNGYFYVNYTRTPDGDTRVSRFTRSATNPDSADANSELILLVVDQPANNHNGGCLKFGPDGYLYTSLGDGGGANDPQNFAQNKKSLLGKMLRIDVNAGPDPYRVPNDNPFVNDTTYLPEIWSLGWRNPWRFSFDRLTGDMWVADVGQDTREEIDFEPAGVGGRNYGWRCYEGALPFNTAGCQPAANYTFPVFDYDNASLGCSVTGGFVYRGSRFPELNGLYLFADFCSGRWWGTRYDAADSTFNTVLLANLTDFEYAAFGEDVRGELYVAELSGGRILRIEDRCADFAVDGAVSGSPVCPGANGGSIELSATGGSNPIQYLWADGVAGPVRSALPAGVYAVTATDGQGCSRVLSFDLPEGGTPDPVLTTDRPVVCPDETVTLTAANLQPPVTLRWEVNGSLFSTVAVNETVYTLSSNVEGTWTVSFFDSVCLETRTAELTIAREPELTPLIEGAGDSLVYNTTDTTLALQWYRNNQMIPGATQPYLLPTAEGEYFLEVTTANGCRYESNRVILQISTTMPEWVTAYTLSPNPTSDRMRLYLALDAPKRLMFTLSDHLGRVYFSQSRQGSVFDFPLELQALPRGAYTLTVQSDAGQWSRWVIKN
ncbi:MAG: PQQ-dependent sugar dehydrogenase [Saprospiraceae bacterium]|nr:PQQ-dependent sugar dehydrogenase [Saprospiraceae bacterium]